MLKQLCPDVRWHIFTYLPLSDTTSVAHLTQNTLGKRSPSIYLGYLGFILLNWISSCYADAISHTIRHHKMYNLYYNPSKTAAIASIEYNTAIYINFKTHDTYTIMPHQPGLIFTTWLSDTVANVETSCGSGCTKSLIFIAPNITLACTTHEYRIENLDPNMPPDYYNNTPLLIDPKRGIYVCYDENNTIQVYPFPRHASIHPPKGYFANKASLVNDRLVVHYEDRHGHAQQISY